MAYKSMEDLRSIVALKVSEGLGLEYKGSKVIENSDVFAICKTVTAFANSIGGQFVVGVEQATKQRPTALDGGVQGASRRDWLYQIVSANTFPAVETLEVDELSEVTGSYYIITVGASSKAPHQCCDHKYYKRRGSHSEPMEHYEIEDVRHRPKAELVPLKVSLVKDEGLIFLRFFNTLDIEDVSNIHCHIDANVDFQVDGIDTLASEGIRRLPPREELIFVLDSIGMLLAQRDDAQFKVNVDYDCFGQTKHDSQTFYMADFKRSSILREPIPSALYRVEERLKFLSEGVRDLVREAKKLETIADGSGLRLSQRTIAAIQGREGLFDPGEFDIFGYKIILGATNDEAFKLNGVFHTMIPAEEAQRNYNALPEELREKFERHFRVTFRS